MVSTVCYRKSDNWMMETVYSELRLGNLSKGAINSLKAMLPLARMCPLAVMHAPRPEYS